MINPIGTFLVHTDAALTGSMNGIIGYMTASMGAPITVCASIYYAWQGFRFVNGDGEPLQEFVPNLIRVSSVLWLSSNLSAFNQWVTNIFFTGLPNALSTAVGNGTGTPSSLTGTAAAFDNLWAQIWTMVGTLLAQATGYSVNSAIMLVGAVFVIFFGLACLAVLVIVYECARFLLAVLICVMPIVIGCALFDVTRPFFERAIGKGVSLILMQVCGLIVMQLVLMSDQWFMAQAVTAQFNVMAAKAQGASGSEAVGELLAMLVGLTLWFFAGAVAMWNVPILAYSIGGGIMMRGPPIVRMWNALRGRGGRSSASAAEQSSIPLAPTVTPMNPPPALPQIPYPQPQISNTPNPPPPPPLHLP